MPHIHRHKGWEIPSSQTTPEQVYTNRRHFLRQLGLAALGSIAAPSLLGAQPPSPTAHLYPAPRNEAFGLDRPLTDETVAATYNNFYEFTTAKDMVHRLAKNFRSRPWQVEVSGLVHKPGTYAIDDLVGRMPLEERLYRFRCVEAWAMAVPWTGFPLRALLDEVQPQAAAKYVRFVTFFDPQMAPGQAEQPWYPWPYYEGLTIEEAANDLTLLATGIYGRELPAQHGAPIRLVVPWKYGFKSIKSVVAIEFVEHRPPTFWNTLVPDEYDFGANVDPAVPHPRWSQATERLLGSGESVPTRPYNGYGEYVAQLYGKRL